MCAMSPEYCARWNCFSFEVATIGEKVADTYSCERCISMHCAA